MILSDNLIRISEVCNTDLSQLGLVKYYSPIDILSAFILEAVKVKFIELKSCFLVNTSLQKSS